VLARLNPRERVLVLGGGTLLLLLAVWMYVWQPLMAERVIQQDRIARYLSVIEIARSADTGVPVLVQSPVALVPIGPRITQSAAAADIPLARLDPDGAQLQITVAKAGYAELIAWIASLETSEGVRALSVDMSRLTEPGQVSLRLLLEDTQ
jgi:general secretion pathway protein M